MNASDGTPMPRRRLRLRRRPEEASSASSASSLFARLSPSIATDLENNALCLASSEDQLKESSNKGWNILSHSNGGENRRVDFLPLSVTFAAPDQADDITIYVSYNGGYASASTGTRHDAPGTSLISSEAIYCLVVCKLARIVVGPADDEYSVKL